MKLTELVFENQMIHHSEIPAENMGYLELKIAELNKKGSKIGAMPITIQNLGSVNKTVDASGILKRFYKIQITGNTPKIDGWRLIGALDHEDGQNVVKVVPGEVLPLEFRRTDPTRCDFCHTQRDRVHSYIVANDAEQYKQVGKTCLKNFLGHENPAAILATASLLGMLDEILKDASDENFGGIKNTPPDTLTFLAYVSAIIEKIGWVPKSAEYGDKISTARMAEYEINSPYSKREYNPTEEDYEVAQKALTWIQTELARKNNKSDYEHNIVIIGSKKFLDSRHLGFAASIIPAYNRAMEKQKVTTTVSEKPSNYVGEVGKRFGAKGIPPLDLQLLGIKITDSIYGTTSIHRFVDNEGNFFVWFASSSSGLEVGNKYKIAASVKKHERDKYNKDVKTTYLTRVKAI
jgi:hypothetical protein